ncbi:hypothetical protein CPT09_27535 [Klebsiella pneumoniae]|nr:hypothetical protein CPT09_27535 [Klebsiella pneumoniae]
MAAPLRYTLILLAWGAMAAIYLPLFPAAGELVGAARSPAHWRALFADPQLGQALAEPHAAWVDALEQEWLRRYGTH